MERKKLRLCLAVLWGCLCLAWASASANPMFFLDTAAQWQAALTQGRIVPVSGSVFAAMVAHDSQWPPEYQSASFFDSVLSVPTNPWIGEPGLYMTWGSTQNPPPTGQQMAAAWDYVYGLDPALTGAVIDFSIFPPVPGTLLSLNLIDKNNNYREWIWQAGAGAGQLPAGQWSTLSIDPVTGASNWATFGGSPFIHAGENGQPFDLSSIQILRFDENIRMTPGFPAGPMGNVPNGWVWNMWDHVDVHPEPCTLVLLGAGLLGIWARRRKAAR